MGRVTGKVCIVTGAARGIGAAVARRLVAEGAKVMLTDVSQEEGAQLARELGSSALFEKHDVTSAADWQRVVESTESAMGAVSVLVNNAGIMSAVGPFEQITEEDFRRVIDVNLIGVFLGMKAVLASMRRAGSGSIVNFSSVAGLVGSHRTDAYTASKFAVRGLTKSVALDLAQYGIRVNSVHPGIVDTPMVSSFIPSENTEVFKKATSPLGRLGTPQDMAHMVLFLASDESSFATGAEFVVDGGYTAR